MTVVIVPSSQLGLRHDPNICYCVFGGAQAGVIEAHDVASLVKDGVLVSASVSDYLSTESFSNSNDSLYDIVDAHNTVTWKSCGINPIYIMMPAKEVFDLLSPLDLNIIEQQKMLGGNDHPAFRRTFESIKRMHRRGASSGINIHSRIDSEAIHLAVISDLNRGRNFLLHRLGGVPILVPPPAGSFVDLDGVRGWLGMSDGMSASSNSQSRSALSSSLDQSASLCGFGTASYGSHSLSMGERDYKSTGGGIFCFSISAGYPAGLDKVIDGSLLPYGQTYRQSGSSRMQINFSSAVLRHTSARIFRENGKTIGSFVVNRLGKPPFYLSVCGVSPRSTMSSHWYGMISHPAALIDDVVRPIFLGLVDAKCVIDGVVIGDDLEYLLSVATSSVNPLRYAVRRCLEHQFLGRPLKLVRESRQRKESGISDAESYVWNVGDADPDLGMCLPDEMWCAIGSHSKHNWKVLIDTCSNGDSNWHAYRFRHPNLPVANPFRGMRLRPEGFNSSNAAKVASLSYVGAREVVDTIRWELFEWTRHVGRHIVDLVRSKGMYSAAGTDGWKTETSGLVEA
jgi:hypothetical protein